MAGAVGTEARGWWLFQTWRGDSWVLHKGGGSGAYDPLPGSGSSGLGPSQDDFRV
jgi:hypothetical protein